MRDQFCIPPYFPKQLCILTQTTLTYLISKLTRSFVFLIASGRIQLQRHTGSSSGSSSALCLALEKGGPPQNWAPLVLAPCTSSDRKQQWRYTAGARPVLQYAGYKNGNGNAMCIQIDGENPWLGSPAGLWPCSAAGEWCVASMCASCNSIQSIFFGGNKKTTKHTMVV